MWARFGRRPHSSKPLFDVSTVEACPVAPVDELEEEDRAALGHRQVADLVHDQERRVGQGLEAADGLGLLEGKSTRSVRVPK